MIEAIPDGIPDREYLTQVAQGRIWADGQTRTLGREIWKQHYVPGFVTYPGKQRCQIYLTEKGERALQEPLDAALSGKDRVR